MMETIFGIATCINIVSNGLLMGACYPPKLIYPNREQCEYVLRQTIDSNATLNRNAGNKAPGDEGYLWTECVEKTIPVWHR